MRSTPRATRKRAKFHARLSELSGIRTKPSEIRPDSYCTVNSVLNVLDAENEYGALISR